MDRSLQTEILERVNEMPEKRCICFYGPEEAVCWQSREELYARAVRIAHQLKLRGVQRGSICIIVLASGETAANILLAMLFLGAIPLLVAPPTLIGGNLEIRQTLHNAIRRTRARLVVYSPFDYPGDADLKRTFPTASFVFAEALMSEATAVPLSPVCPGSSEVAAMQLTSGTTSAPRICVWNQKAVMAALDGMSAAMALSSRDICVNWTPLYHDMGLVNNFLLCLTQGVPLVILSPHEFVRRPALWLRCLSQTGATLTWSPNFGFAITSRKTKNSDLEGIRLSHVRAFWNAAERIHQRTLEEFYQRFSVAGVRREALKTNFGCAENIGGATFSSQGEVAACEYIERDLLDKDGVARTSTCAGNTGTLAVVSCGRACPGTVVRILSRHGRSLPDGQIGEICLQSPSQMLGYHHNAVETRRALRGGLLHTGDLGYLRNGDLFWVGRLRERITIHGKKLDPSALEGMLASIEGVREGCFAAFGVPDEQVGTERLVIVVEVRVSGIETLATLKTTICQQCLVELGVVPKEVVLVRPGTLAKTSSGKRRHRHFRTLYLANRLAPDRISFSATHLSPPNAGEPPRAHVACKDPDQDLALKNG